MLYAGHACVLVSDVCSISENVTWQGMYARKQCFFTKCQTEDGATRITSLLSEKICVSFNVDESTSTGAEPEVPKRFFPKLTHGATQDTQRPETEA